MRGAGLVTRIAQQVGGAVGVATLAVILQSAATSTGPVAAFRQSFWWATGFTAAGAALCPLLPGRIRATAPAPVPAAA